MHKNPALAEESGAVIQAVRAYWKSAFITTPEPGMTNLKLSPSMRTSCRLVPEALMTSTEATSQPSSGETLKLMVEPARASETEVFTAPPRRAEVRMLYAPAELAASSLRAPLTASGSGAVPAAEVGNISMTTLRSAIKTSMGRVTLCRVYFKCRALYMIMLLG